MAVSCMVAELWQFENFRPKFDLDLLYQGQRSFKNNIIDAHLVSIYGFNHRTVSCMAGKL